MPTQAESIAILRRALPGLVPEDPANPDGPAYGDPSGSLELHSLRGSRESELENRLANDQFGRPDPNTGRDAALLRFLKGDMASDPDTGTAATARTQKVQSQLDDAASFDRPELADMRRTKAADAEHLASAAARTTGEYGLKHQALENEGGIEKQRIASEGLVEAAGMKGKSGAGSTGRGMAQIMTRVAEGSNMIESLARLRELKDQTWTGPGASRAQTFLQKVPLLQGSDKYAAFEAESAALNNTLIHAMTGAQSSKEERDRILAQAPQPTDQDNAWKQHADVTERVIKGLNVRFSLLQAGVSPAELDRLPVEAYADYAPAAADAAGGGRTAAPAADPTAGHTIRRGAVIP
jgi:hypothetical protein